VSNGATLQLQDGITVGAEALSLNGGAASGQTGALVNVSGTNSYGGAVTVTASSSISAASGSVLNLTGGVVKDGTVATFNGGGTINVNTVAISGSSPNSDLVIDGTTVNLGVASTYNGPTFIRNSGTLNANVTNALPTANGRTAVTFDGTGTSVLSLAAAQSVASLTSAGAATVTLGANALTVGASTGSTTFAGIIGGTGGLTKDGASTQPLTGANTYTGGTTINGGTLELSGASGALTATSAVNISGGTLSLSGSAANRISNTASISLGAAGSTLQLSGAVIETLGAMTLAGGVGARVIDFGVTSGVLTLASLSAASNLPLHIWNWSGTTGTGGGTDRLVISSGFLGGSLAASNVSFFSGSGTGLYSGATTFTASGGELVPSVSVSVPEPGTFFPAAVLVAGAFLRRRRGRCRAARA
jgi:autotransporter-associated beta strand protein